MMLHGVSADRIQKLWTLWSQGQVTSTEMSVEERRLLHQMVLDQANSEPQTRIKSGTRPTAVITPIVRSDAIIPNRFSYRTVASSVVAARSSTVRYRK